MKRLILIVFGIALVLNTPLSAQQASQNIPVLPVIPKIDPETLAENPDWYLRGDGYLQRQVEPTIAVSTRNPDHLLSFFVDYRAVNIPGDPGLGEQTQTFVLAMKATNMMLAGLIPLPEVPLFEVPPVAAAEAWVGGSASHDGGLTWSGFMMPGASFDHSLISEDSPVYGLEAATDPVAVAGPCGYVYVSFMGFTRGDMSKLVVARFQDLNDSESGRTWQYQGAWELESGNNATHGYFLDKPHIALDIFREDSDVADYSQYYPADESQCGHRVYVSYSTFNGLDKGGKFQSKLNFATSVDRGETWTQSRIQQPYTQNQGSFIAVDPRPGNPGNGGGGSVYVVWRHFFSPDAIVMIKTENYGKKFSKPIELTGDIPMQPFDQPTLSAWDGESPPSPDYLTARSNAFPTTVVTPEGEHGTVFVAWQEKVDITEGGPTLGQPDATGSPRIVMVKSTDGGSSWTGIGDSESRVAVDFGYRDVNCVPGGLDYPDVCQQPPGFGVLPDRRPSGPQVKPWLSFGGGKLALAYTEARGFLDEEGEGTLDEEGVESIGITDDDLSSNGLVSGIDRLVDFRVAMLDPATGQPLDTTQVSRYPISGYADLTDGEQVSDIAPIAPELCDRVNGPPEYCQPSLNLYNKNHSGAGQVPFMGDYPGMTPILSMIYDDIDDEGRKQWRWATAAADVPYPAFHVVFPDNRHLIPPVVPSADPEWARYPAYEFYPDPPTGNCINAGSRNTDVLTAKVNAQLVLSAPTTYKQGSPGDPTWGYPISVFNQSAETRFYQLEILEDRDFASFAVVPGELEFPAEKYVGVVEIFPYSSTSQMVYVDPGASEQMIIEVKQVDWDENIPIPMWVPVDGGQLGYVTLNPDPSNPDIAGSERQNLIITTEAVETYEGDQVIDALNPFVRNPFVRNPFVRNPFVRNTAIDDQMELYKVIDTTWSVQATEDSGAGSYLPVINIDNAEQFLGNYAFQLLIYKNASYGTRALEGCETVNAGNPVILSNVVQSPGDTAENPFVRNPFVRNPFVRNPFVRNPFVRNSAITVAPSDGVVLEESTTSNATQIGAKNLIDENGVLRVPRLPEKIFITLRAFQLVDDATIEASGFRYRPDVDEPAISAVPTRCTDLSDCVVSPSPDLVPMQQDELTYLNPLTLDTSSRGAFPAGTEITFPIDGWDGTWVLKNRADHPDAYAKAENGDLTQGYYLCAQQYMYDHPEYLEYLPLDVSGCIGPLYQDPTPTDNTMDPGEAIHIEPAPSLTIPADTEPGLYYLTVYVDDQVEISEVNEVNNTAFFLIDVLPAQIWDFIGPMEPWYEGYPMSAGSTIPIKWYYEEDGQKVASYSPDLEIRVAGPFDCDLGEDEDTVETVNDAGSSDLRYKKGDWQFNWDTVGLDVGCYNVRIYQPITGQVDGPFGFELR